MAEKIYKNILVDAMMHLGDFNTCNIGNTFVKETLSAKGTFCRIVSLFENIDG